MTAAKSKKQKQHSTVASSPYTCSHELAAQELPPSANGKKNKKKKSKGKEPAVSTFHQASADPNSYDDDLCDEIPSLEEAEPPTSPRTGLSPLFESVHVSATTVSRSSNGMTTQVKTQLLATELHGDHAETPCNGHAGGKRSQAMPQFPLPKTTGQAGPGMVDEEYWSAFPPHIKTFAQTMYNIAQQMVQSDSYMKGPTTAAMTTRGLSDFSADACPPLPFDPAILSDPAFTLSVEQAAAEALKAAPPPSGQPPRGPHPQSNVVLLNEFGGSEHRLAEDDYYSEDDIEGKYEGEDLDGFDFHPSMVSDPSNMPDAIAQVVLSYGEHVTRAPAAAAQPTLVATSHDQSVSADVEPVATSLWSDESSAGRKGKKKKGDKNGTDAPAGTPTAPVPNAVETRSASPASGLSPEKDGRPLTAGLESPQPLTANAMPAARKENLPANPPPSSRAQGKQPMAYVPTTTATATTAQANGQQTRTARAASKAPMSAHNYNHSHHHPSPPSSNASATNKSRSNAASGSNKNPQSNNKIWSTSSTEERERIKEFWLGLGEDERRNLVKIEKDTVLKKMKEQQKHSCSCAVCGRKRHAIEEELEVLYDAYYEELERYANHQQRYVSSGGTIPPPPGPGPFPGSVELDKNGVVIGHPQTKSPRNPSRTNRTAPLTNGRKPPKPESEFEDDEGDEDEFEEEDGYDEEEEEEEEDEEDEAVDDEDDIKPRDRRNAGTRGRRPVNGTKSNGRDGLFNLGSSLTVTGPNNILTVADDLLKNDGQKFLEMMEQLAERRMQREEEAAADVEDDSEEEDDEEDDDEDEDEEEDEDEDDEEVMTEEQKMEEGKRMFSMFAARMFEQRVLQAYREKVAQERQQQLLRELEAEDQLTKEREAKKQTQNQKKKDKRRQQKQAKEEERAAKAAEKAAEEAALRAKQLAQEEEQRKKREEERARREASRKAAEEERQRKEEERRKRIAEEREREAERERKRKEKEEKAKREREEKERKAREEREAKAAAERAAKKEQQEREEREKKLAKEREEKAEKERAAQQQRAAAKNARQPTSPRPSGSAQRSQSTNGAAKKILTKPASSLSSIPTPAPVSTTPNNVRTQPQRPLSTTSQPNTPLVQSTPNQFPPSLYPTGASIASQAVNTPRLPYAPQPFGVFNPGPSVQQTSLVPPALSRGYGSPSPFDPSFGRPLAATPLATSSKAIQNPLSSPTLLAPGSSRRSSVPEPGPGPVARPLSIAPLTPGPMSSLGPIAPPAPIARPTGEPSGSNSGSPIRRTPSPKVLGSSALAADDDEVVPPARRVPSGPMSQSWGNSTSPRTIMGEMRGPWGNPTSTAFPTRPPIGSSLWGGMNANSEWQAPPTSFFSNSFVNNHTNSSPSPHSGNN